MPSWAYQNGAGQPSAYANASRRIATAPSQTDMAGLLRPGSLARSRGVQRRGAGRPSGSTTRGCIRPRVGSVRNSSASSASTVGVGSRASSSRKNSRSPPTRSHPGVAAGGDAEVGRQPVGADPVGQSGRLPAVAHHHDIQVHVPLLQQGLQPALQIAAPLAHGQHHDAVAGSGRRHAGHRSLGELSTAARWPTTVTAAATQSPISSPCVATPVEPEIEHRGHQDQQRQLDGVEDPVERHEPGDPPGRSQRALGRLADRLGVLHLRQTGVVPGHVHQIVLDLVQADQQPEQQPETHPDVAQLELAGGPDPQGHGDPALGDVVTDPIQVDTLRRRRLPPARHLTVAAVQQHLQLDEHHGQDRARQRPPGRGERGQHACRRSSAR